MALGIIVRVQCEAKRDVLSCNKVRARLEALIGPEGGTHRPRLFFRQPFCVERREPKIAVATLESLRPHSRWRTAEKLVPVEQVPRHAITVADRRRHDAREREPDAMPAGEWSRPMEP